MPLSSAFDRRFCLVKATFKIALVCFCVCGCDVINVTATNTETNKRVIVTIAYAFRRRIWAYLPRRTLINE